MLISANTRIPDDRVLNNQCWSRNNCNKAARMLWLDVLHKDDIHLVDNMQIM